MEKCLFDKWYDNIPLNLSRFQTNLFEAFVYADGTNKNKMTMAWPEFFSGTKHF